MATISFVLVNVVRSKINKESVKSLLYFVSVPWHSLNPQNCRLKSKTIGRVGYEI
jgi:hypothetical protein